MEAAAEGKNKREGVVRAERIEAESVVIVHPGGDYKMSLAATESGCGIWIEDRRKENAPMIAIYKSAGQTCIGIYGPGERDAVDIGLAVADAGDPFIQITKGDKTKTVDLDDL